MSISHLPYCGSPPVPGELLTRFNLDPVLIALLLLLGAAHFAISRTAGARRCALGGWLAAAAAFISPLCALSVSLFSARIAQHMILVLLAAPLIALALPRASARLAGRTLWSATAVFFAALWFWHMPLPYEATFNSTGVYWMMHLTLFGSAIVLWRQLLQHGVERTAETLAAAALSSMQMGLLGAVLTLASHPLFAWHLTTAGAWGLTPLQDQQLGGTLMWVPGILLFLWASLRSLHRLWGSLERGSSA
ncbi:MAG TPA: cytochrome c oxidase assembly protein [Steroidobacteraceae bacterium]